MPFVAGVVLWATSASITAEFRQIFTQICVACGSEAGRVSCILENHDNQLGSAAGHAALRRLWPRVVRNSAARSSSQKFLRVAGAKVLLGDVPAEGELRL